MDRFCLPHTPPPPRFALSSDPKTDHQGLKGLRRLQRAGSFYPKQLLLPLSLKRKRLLLTEAILNAEQGDLIQRINWVWSKETPEDSTFKRFGKILASQVPKISLSLMILALLGSITSLVVNYCDDLWLIITRDKNTSTANPLSNVRHLLSPATLFAEPQASTIEGPSLT